MATRPAIYISRARADDAWARALARALSAQGADIAVADAAADDGAPLDDAIAEQIRAHPIFVLVLSRAAQASPRVAREAQLADQLQRAVPGRTFVPITIEPILPSGALYVAEDYMILLAQALSIEDVASRVLFRASEGDRRVGGFLGLGARGPNTGATAPGAAAPAAGAESTPVTEEEAEAAAEEPDILYDEQYSAPPGASAGEESEMRAPYVPAPRAPAPPPSAGYYAPPGAYGAPAPAPAHAATTAEPTTEAQTVEFSALHPTTIAVETTSTLLVYAHLPDDLALIQADAATFEELGSGPKLSQARSRQRIVHGVELTIEPHLEGVTFSPPRESFVWRGTWHRSLFHLRAAATLGDTVQAGWVDVFADRIAPVATIELAIPFHFARARLSTQDLRGIAVTGNRFDSVFISYSHQDTEAMRQARRAYQRMRVTVYSDEGLRPGDNFDVELADMIRSASVFHLLWSRQSAASDYVRKEWTMALGSQKGARFIRPWYWRQPLVKPPSEFEARKISFKYEPLKRELLRPSTWR